MIVSYNNNIVSFNNVIVDSIPPKLKLLILGDSNANTVKTNISNQLTTLGYSDFTISAITMGTTYSGSGLTPTDYNCILYYTNSSQYGSASLPTNLLNYRNLNGNIVTAVSSWALRPAGWSDSNLTNFVGPVSQVVNRNNINILTNHPIFLGVSSAITDNFSFIVNNVVSIQPGATNLATFSSNGRPFLATRTVGSSRLVSVNTFPIGINTYSNMRRLITNSVLWAAGITN